MNTMITKALADLSTKFREFDEISLSNQRKVLQSFKQNNIALRHFNGTSGYGYDDVGRDGLCRLVADIFHTDASIASPYIVSGTHAISLSLFGILRPNDTVLSVSGEPYDTLQNVIYAKGVGSLADFGIRFESIELTSDGDFDYDKIREYLTANSPKMIYIQRSKGYSWRLALSIEQIRKLVAFVRNFSQAVIFCDNCYGEFVDSLEPTDVGVDICAGSFIKNIGGGLAPTGGYIVGKQHLIDTIAGRLTAPSIGLEVGSYAAGYRPFYQGIFMAPHVVNQALKTAALFSKVLTDLGYEVMPKIDDCFGDIVCSVKLGDPSKVIKFCQAIQAISPVDGFVTPEPWEQPGYNDKVIMAAGCFVQGSSIELSCDGPIRSPYIVYLQGGLTFEHGILALEQVLESI